MIEEISTVTGINGDKITVKSELKSGCSGCKQIDNCGSGQVAQAMPQLKLKMEVTATTVVNIGDKVVIGIPEKALLATAAKVYLLPLIGLVSFSALGQYFIDQSILSHELYALALGVFGGFVGHIIARNNLLSVKQVKELTPKLLRKNT